MPAWNLVGADVEGPLYPDADPEMPTRQTMKAALGLALLLAHSITTNAATASSEGSGVASSNPPPVSIGPRPRIYIYELPARLMSTTGGAIGHRLEEQIRLRGFHEPDPHQADFFWIPGGGMYPGTETRRGRELLTAIFEHVRDRHPWWNMTVALGQARHVIAVLLDGGIGEAFSYPGIQGENGLPPGEDDLPPGVGTNANVYSAHTKLPLGERANESVNIGPPC